jgi:hypothetical protein
MHTWQRTGVQSAYTARTMCAIEHVCIQQASIHTYHVCIQQASIHTHMKVCIYQASIHIHVHTVRTRDEKEGGLQYKKAKFIIMANVKGGKQQVLARRVSTACVRSRICIKCPCVMYVSANVCTVYVCVCVDMYACADRRRTHVLVWRVALVTVPNRREYLS